MFAQIEELLLGPSGMRYLQLLRDLALGRPVKAEDEELVEELKALGLCRRNDPSPRLTAFGQKCADSCREYLFWIERDRRLHGEGVHPVVDVERFRGMDVLEVGPGWGCNLLRIASVARSVTGLEIEPVYVKLSKVFARLEDMQPPELFVGRAEDMPFGDGSFDCVLLFSALQYMDINLALKEFSRVLRPGGLVLSTQAPLGRFVREATSKVVRELKPRALLSEGAAVANTLWYQRFGKRLRENINGNATARPIYPTTEFLVSRAAQSRLRHRVDLSFDAGSDVGLVLQRQ